MKLTRNEYARIFVTAMLCLSLLLLLFTACNGPGTGDPETSGEDGISSDSFDVTEEESTSGAGETTGEGSDTDETTEAAGTTDASENTDPTGTTGATETTEAGGETTETVTSEETTGGSETTAPPQNTKVTYSVTVVDSDGKPIKTVIVRFYKNGVQVKMASTNSSGVATASLDAGEYTFTLEKTGGGNYLYDKTRCVLTERDQSIRITFVETLGDNAPGEIIYARPNAESDHKEYFAAYVEEGTTAVNLTAGDMTYFIFTPTRSGIFRFSAESSASVDIGYYGGTFNVQLTKAIEMTGNYFEISIRQGSVGGAQFVIGLKTLDGKAASAMVKIERTGDVKPDSSEAPWNAVAATEKYLVKYTGDTSGVLTNVDITDAATKLVYNAADGYYHFGTEDGPVVMLRISSASPYIAAFSTICETSALGCYYYDANGDFLRKDQYNDMIASYQKYVDAEGVVPLNDELISMVKTVGTHMGWWNETSPQYIFGSDADGKPIPEVTEIAWMFACCYYKK